MNVILPLARCSAPNTPLMPSPGKPKILRTSREPAPTFSEFVSQSQSAEEGPKLKGAELGAHSTTRSDGGLRESRRRTIHGWAGRFLSRGRAQRRPCEDFSQHGYRSNARRHATFPFAAWHNF